jgi:lipoprotein-releasing system permease protein
MQKYIFLFKSLIRSRQGSAHVFMAQIAIWAVAVSTAAIIIVSSIMNGFHYEMQNRIIGQNSHVRIIELSSLAEAKKIASTIKNDPEFTDIVSINCYMLSRARIVHAGIVREVFVKSLSKEDTIQVGYFLADSINLINPREIFYIITRLGEYKFNFSKRFETGLYDLDNNFIFLPEVYFTSMFKNGNYTAGLEIYINKAENASLLANKLKAKGYKTIAWEDVNRSLAEAMRAEERMIQLILFFVTLLAGFSILSTVYMTIQGKRKSLALIRLAGVSSKQIMVLLIAYGCFVSLVGLCVGFFLGWVVLTNLNGIAYVFRQYMHYELFPKSLFFSAQISVRYALEDYLFVFYLTMLITLIGSIYPAIKAASYSLIRDLRNYE